MSISSEHKRRKKTVADANGNHIPVSEWTHADSVELPNGLTLAESEAWVTDEEYEALTEAEKCDGRKYYVLDSNSTEDTPIRKIMMNNEICSGLNIQINTWEEFD